MGMRAAAFFAALLLVGCGREVILLVDPEVTLPDGGGYTPMGDPVVEIGFYNEQLYAPLETGGACPVVHGLQGGTWTMPAVRIKGMDTPATVSCTLQTATGENLGEVSSQLDFFLANDGWLEVQSYPVPVAHEAPNEADPIDDLYGAEATLSCDVTDEDGRSATTAMEVVLEEG